MILKPTVSILNAFFTIISSYFSTNIALNGQNRALHQYIERDLGTLQLGTCRLPNRLLQHTIQSIWRP